MTFFFYPNNLEVDEKQWLSEEDAHHLLHVRRLRLQEEFQLQDARGRRFLVQAQQIQKQSIQFQVLAETIPPPASPLQLSILQSLPKEKSQDFIVQKLTELGVTELVCFAAHFSQQGYRLKDTPRFLERWHKISLEACKQSGRAQPLKLSLHADLSTALQTVQAAQGLYVLTSTAELAADLLLSAKSTLLPLPKLTSAQFIIGPEGGLHLSELELALEKKFLPLHLGERVLRAETAAIAISTLAQYLWGDLF